MFKNYLQKYKYMKPAFSLIIALCFWLGVSAQTLNLSISNPQPRIGQSFTVTVNIDTLNETLFHFLSPQFKVSLSKDQCSTTPEMSVDLEAKKIGKNEIGPLTIEFNGIKYKTNKISFNVDDSLPTVNKGYWIRKVKVDDTTVLILTEQRIPALTYYDHSANSINITTKTNDDEKEAELTWMDADVANAKVNMTGGRSEMQSIYVKDKELKYKYCYWGYKITIIDQNKPVILRKSDFTNLPDYYKFENIIVN